MKPNPKWDNRQAWLDWVREHMAKYFSAKATITVVDDDKYDDEMRITVDDPELGTYQFSQSPSDEFFITCVAEEPNTGFCLTIPNPQDMWI